MSKGKWFLYSRVFAAMLCLVVLSACASGPKFAPFAGKLLKGEGTRMAILPFDNLSKTQGAAKTLENIVLIEFLKQSVKTIDPGEMTAALSEERIRLATSIPKETVLALGKKLGVDYFIVGIVHEYELQLLTGAGGAGQVPLVALTMRIIDANTGEIVWAINATRSGKDRETVFGIGKIDSLNALAELTAQDIALAFVSSLQK